MTERGSDRKSVGAEMALKYGQELDGLAFEREIDARVLDLQFKLDGRIGYIFIERRRFSVITPGCKDSQIFLPPYGMGI